MFNLRILKTLGIVCFALIALAGCRPEEQGRPLSYEPGVFPGKNPSAGLSDADLVQLRQRSLMQGGDDASLGGGGGPSQGEDVRPPAVESSANQALDKRGKLQSGN